MCSTRYHLEGNLMKRNRFARSFAAFLYFFTYLILAQMIMLNLVVAVLLINYGG